jgi:hypothetical protein
MWLIGNNTEATMDENRKQNRIATDLPVTLVSVLDSREGRIIDLSEGGAQIMGASFPKDARFQIDYRDQTIYARVMWDEVDRMGVRFEFPLSSGPLADAMRGAQISAQPTRPFVGGLRPAGQIGFGRRAA